MRLLHDVQEEMRARLRQAAKAAMAAGDLPPLDVPEFQLETPKDPAHGDLASNLALMLAKPAGRSPRLVAEALLQHLDAQGTPLARTEVAGPGFINLFFAPGWLLPVVVAVLAEADRYGTLPVNSQPTVLVEYVSANPTGPLNVVNARAAAFGDALCNVLAAAGHAVIREFYVNDAGNQFENLCKAVAWRYAQLQGQELPMPEGAYPGEYMLAAVERAAVELAQEGKDVAALPEAERTPLLARRVADNFVREAEATLLRYGVRFDHWVRESALRAAGVPERVVQQIRERGLAYEEDGALWFRTSAFGDDKDRVIVKRDGHYTYVVPDIGYHQDKLTRAEHVIDVLGADHHGYVGRMRAALAALGYDPARFEVIINQMVHLVRGGEKVRMSKRRGELVTMDEFLAEVDVDAARFFFLMRTIDSHMEFDLDLANLKTSENPVYYVQYAHARISGILSGAAEAGVDVTAALARVRDEGRAALEALGAPEEVALMRLLAQYPEELLVAAELREPHRLTLYARELATAFHAFYTRCRVLGEAEAVTRARLALAAAVRQVLANALGLLGVSAPERM